MATRPDSDLSSGGYVLVNTTIRRDGSALVTGSCDVMYWSSWPPPGVCQYFFTTTRYLSGIDFLVSPPTLLPSHYFAFAPYQITQWDTRGTIYGVSGIASEEGTWRYQFQSSSDPTTCTASLKSPITEKQLQVVACLPTFHPTAQTARLPLDQDIKVNLPHGDDPNDPLTNAFFNAVAVWKAQLATYNIALPNIVASPNLCSLPLDHGHCIQVYVQPPPDNNLACAETQAHAGADGNFDQPAVISINPAFQNWSDAFQKETLEHEFGHLFDLANQDPVCPNGGSIMNAPVDVPCDNMTGRATAPQPVDVAAVAKSTYGSTPRKMCR